VQAGHIVRDDWWDLFMSVHGGAKATTLDQYDRRTPVSDEPPAGPLLTHWPGHGGMHGRELGVSGLGLWLWPLPPADTTAPRSGPQRRYC
jgi:hypothetical protein